MPLTLNNTNTLTADNIVVSGSNLSDLYATINYVNTNTGGISQQDLDDSLAPLVSKDIAYNSTLQSHISLIDTNTADIATHTNDIAVLNTKQLQTLITLMLYIQTYLIITRLQHSLIQILYHLQH